MTSNDTTRRTVLTVTGASLGMALIAGCSGDGNGDGNGNGDDDGNGNGDAAFEIEPGTRILFEGLTGGYVGIEPPAIEGEENPTLVLEDGGEYEIGWTQGDGMSHNIQIWDADENIVGDYATDLIDDPGDGDFLEITATDEMAYYRCDPHPGMQGEIRVE